MKRILLKINNLLLFVVFFLTFLGFYSILLLMLNNNLRDLTRQVTIPLRAGIGLSLILLILININKIRLSKEVLIYIFFSTLFLLRIYIDSMNMEVYYISYVDVLNYFISFSIIPFISFTTYRLNEKNLKYIFYALLSSGFLFSILSIIFYGSFIGSVNRLSSTSSEEIISPLILSYCSTLIIGVCISYVLYNKTNLFIKILCVSSIALSSVPFFLGASRGSLLALFFPFVFFLISEKKHFVRNLLLIILLITAIIYVGDSLESGLLERFLSTSEAIDHNSESAIRLKIWDSSLSQFIDNPFFGDKLRVNNWENYPHNLILECLQALGIVGFLPFIFLIIKALIYCFKIIKYNKKYVWLVIIFMQSFIQNMFSGSISTAAWFWTSLGLVFCVRHFLIDKKNINE